MIKQLMESQTKIVRQAAVYALCTEPFRKEAKESYLHILRSGEYGVDRTAQSCKASVEFHWTEAIPLIGELATKPLHVRNYAVLIRTRRTLEGNSIGKDLIEAEQTLMQLVGAMRPLKAEPSIAAARKRLIDSDDAEGANLAALSLAVFVTKGNTELVNQMGIEILRARPRKETLEFLQSLAESIHKENRQEVEDVIEAVKSSK